MDLIDSITVCHQGNNRSVSLLVGDLAAIPEGNAVDLLVVSAFPDDYTPTGTSLIGSLDRVGVSVSALAEDKEVDLRRFSSCWLSREIMTQGVNFRRILCFEPRYRGRAEDVVGDIFRSLIPFTGGTPPVCRVAIPIVASGDQGESATVMLESLTEAAVKWLSIGMQVDCINIIVTKSCDSQALRDCFARVTHRCAATAATVGQSAFRYDLFVSYCQKDKETVDDLRHELHARRPSLRVFVDRLELRPGMAWQQHIFDAIDESRKVMCVYSPDYLASRICKEEFNIAHFRHRESTDGVLLPVYAFTAELPTYMKLVQYEDIREGDREKLTKLAEGLAVSL
jgi:hypothetical protein